MASTIAFLSFACSAASLFRHWALVIMLWSLLSRDNPSNFIVNAKPTLILHGLPNNIATDLNSSVSIAQTPITVTPFSNVSYSSNPLVTVSLENVSSISSYFLTFSWKVFHFFGIRHCFRSPMSMNPGLFWQLLLLTIHLQIILSLKLQILLPRHIEVWVKVGVCLKSHLNQSFISRWFSLLSINNHLNQ